MNWLWPKHYFRALFVWGLRGSCYDNQPLEDAAWRDDNARIREELRQAQGTASLVSHR